jgi:hypothetical protein
MTIAEIEKRLTALEQEIAELRQERNAKPHPAQVLKRIHGTFENDAAFQEATRLGKRWRASQDPKPRRSPTAKRK